MMIDEELKKKILARRARAAAEKEKRQSAVKKVEQSPVAAPLTNEQINAIRAANGWPPLPDPETDPAKGKSFVQLMGEHRQKHGCGAVVAYQECAKKYPEALQRAREGR
jgi:hypothetical protein